MAKLHTSVNFIILWLISAFVHQGDSRHIRSPLLILIFISVDFYRDWMYFQTYLFWWRCRGWSWQVHCTGESWGLMSLVLVLVLVNDCHSDVSPVNNSDSDAFGYFLGIINWSPIDKSAQQSSNKNSNDIISWDTMHWTFDGFAYLYLLIYSCRIAGQFTSNFRSRACLTMPSLNGITIYRNKLRPFGPLIILACHFGPIFCRFGPNSYDISPHPLEALHPRYYGLLDFSAIFL